MKKLSLILFAALFTFVSCSENDKDPYIIPEGESVVQMSLNLTINTRAPSEDELKAGSEAENKLNTLDLLIFKGDKFQYRRYATKYDDAIGRTFKATVKVDTGLDVYFVVNSRDLIQKLLDDDTIWDDAERANKPNLSWSELRALLIDTAPNRFVDAVGVDNSSNRANLPMWGKVSNVGVVQNTIAYWNPIVIRAVAAVDFYCASTVTDFELDAAYLYFAPDKGILAPSATNEDADNSESAPGMKTITSPLGPAKALNGEIKGKMYLFDNDTDPTTFVSADRRYTRVVLEGKYKGTTYYYPVDFMKKDPITGKWDYDQITRNTKYVFNITEVIGPGYPDPDDASEQPPVNINVDILEWDLKDGSDVGFDGTYYVSLSKREAKVGPYTGSEDYISIKTNANPDVVFFDFKEKPNANGPQKNIVDANGKVTGIENDRFKVEKVLSADGKSIEEIRFTAKGNIDPNTASKNEEIVKIQVGNVKFEIPLRQTQGDEPWNGGGTINPGDLGKN